MKRTAPKPISKKHARELRKAAPIRRAYLAEHPWCQIRVDGCEGKSVEVQERLSRARGGSITAEENLLSVCRSCHSWATTHPKEAESQGWLIPSGGRLS